jgi:hypothetical protein
MSQPHDPFEFLKTLWGPMGLPLPGPLLGLDRSEIDKRIAELRSVENWLDMNLSVLRATLHGLEMQKAALAAVQGTANAAATAQDVPESSPRAPAAAAAGIGSGAPKQQARPRPARRSRK